MNEMNEWMNEWMSEWTNEWMNERVILFLHGFNGKEYKYPVNTTFRPLESC